MAFYCSTCGAELTPGANFCAACGVEVSGSRNPGQETASSASSATPQGAGFKAFDAMLNAFADTFLERITEKRGSNRVRVWAHDIVKAPRFRSLAENLSEVLREGDQLRLFVKAELERPGVLSRNLPGILAVSDEYLLFLPEGEDLEAWRLDEVGDPRIDDRGPKFGPIGGYRVCFEIDDETRSYGSIVPEFEMDRIVPLIEGDRAGPQSPPLGVLCSRFAGNVSSADRVYGDCLVTHDGAEYRITPGVQASVGSAGDLAATRGRNIAAGATGAGVGFALAGPLGAPFGLLAGRSKETIHDTRQLYLLAEGDDWAWSTSASPDDAYRLERFAQSIRLAARLSDTK